MPAFSEAQRRPEVPVDRSGRPVVGACAGSPDWFVRALDTEPRVGLLEVEGARVETLAWGDGPGPGLLLLHGHGAHADWWRPTAPQLVAAAGKVVALSLSGMGGSDWRPRYDIGQYAREIGAVAAASGLLAAGRRPVLAAHSFGCLPLLLCADAVGFDRAIMIDFYLPAPGRARARARPRQPRCYERLAEAMLRFRLAPPQHCPPWMFEFIGRRSLRWDRNAAGQHGWIWCSDPMGVLPVDHDFFRRRLAEVRLPLAMVRGERSSLVDQHVAAHLREVAPPGTLHLEIADAEHHILLDQTPALVATLRTLLALDSWAPATREEGDGR